jgi:hypothetical protein
LTVGKRYKYTFWAKSLTGTPSMAVLSVNASSMTVFILSTTWTQYTGYMTADDPTFQIKRNVGTSNSIYIDDVTLEEVPHISFWEFDDRANLGIDSVTTMANNLTNNGTVTQTYGVNYNEGSAAKWLDQSGNAANFTQATMTKRPAWDSIGINNVPALRFDGVDDAMAKTGDQIGTGDVTVFAVIKANGWGSGNAGRIIETDNSGGKFILSLDSPTSIIKISSDGSTFASSANSAFVLNTSYIVAITRTSSGAVNIYINGTLSGTANQSSGTPVAGTSNTYIGNNAAGNRAFDGWVGAIEKYDYIMPDAKRRRVERALAQEFNIAI